jgi:NADPH2:quinone reductase
MVRSFTLKKPGNYKSLKLTETDLPEPSGQEVRIRNHYIAVNHTDVLHRNGTYKMENFPAIIGVSGAGEVIKCGPDVKNIKVGSLVIYGTNFLGSYSEEINIHEDLVVTNNDLPLDQALSVFFPGMAAHYLISKTYRVKQDDTILIHTATGSVGHILTQWLKHLNVKIIGSVGSNDKINSAKNFGCNHVVNYNSRHFTKDVLELTKHLGVNAVYDSLGEDLFKKNCEILTYFGILINYGDVTGFIKHFNPEFLWYKSLYFTKTNISLYKAHKLEYKLSATEIFNKVKEGAIKPQFRTMNFSEIPRAHKLIEKKQVIGNIIVKL